MATKPKRKKTTARDKRDAELRKLRKEVKTLRDKLAKACDLALDATDVIEEDGIGVDEEESQELRDMIMDLRGYAKRPEAERHVERQQKQQQVQALRDAGLTSVRKTDIPDLEESAPT